MQANIHREYLVEKYTLILSCWSCDKYNGTLCQFIEVKKSKNNAHFSQAIDLVVDHKLHSNSRLFPIAPARSLHHCLMSCLLRCKVQTEFSFLNLLQVIQLSTATKDNFLLLALPICKLCVEWVNIYILFKSALTQCRYSWIFYSNQELISWIAFEFVVQLVRCCMY